MTVLDRFLGLISAFAYALRRSKIAFLRLHVAAVLLGLLLAGYAAIRIAQRGFALTHAILLASCLLFVGLMLWAARQQYIVFKPRRTAVPPGTRDLQAEEKVFLRGSGFFEVSDMRRHLVEVPVVFWSTRLNEHVLAAKVRAPNVLGVGVPSGERGWWYIFIDPRRVVDISPGEMCFGLRLRPAVSVLREADSGRETTYLSCDDAQQLAILLKELQAKAAAVRARHSTN
jgi:hypothetical protein